MSNELKPCPFCGGEAKIRKDITGLTEVWCYDCLTNTGLHPPGDHALKKWNTRPVEDEMYRLLKRQCYICKLKDHETECDICEIEKVLKKARGDE